MPCSIIIPTKNRPAGLSNAVASAIEALPPGGEIIVVDDGCRIPAAEVLAQYVRPALRVVINPGPNGPSGARNHGVDQAQQPIIFFLDDDDALMPDYCRKILEMIPGLPKTVGCGFSACWITSPGQPNRYQGPRQASGVLGPDTPLDKRLTGLGTGFWIRRALFLTVGSLDPKLRVNEDTEFSLRLSAAGVQPYYCSEPGVMINGDPGRDGKDSGSITRSAHAAARAAGFEYILRKHDDFLQDHGEFRRKFMLRILKYRSRARKVEGWGTFCASLRPSFENRLIRAIGWMWLRLSIALRNLRSPAIRPD